MGNIIGKEIRHSVVEKDLKFELVNHVSGEINGCCCQKPSPKGTNLFEVECEHETEDDMVDECYQEFLNCIKEEGDCMVFATKYDRRVKYGGQDVKSSSNSKALVTYNATNFNKGNYNPFETSRLFDSFMEEDKRQCLGSPDTGNRSKFREMLMGKLREPYNYNECEKLLKIINERKPKDGRHRDLRGPAALKAYSKNECNPSYLECHSHLKRKIDAVKSDRPKVLNLLRGFFFWLENLVYEDALVPWKDPLCLAVIPRKHYKILPPHSNLICSLGVILKYICIGGEGHFVLSQLFLIACKDIPFTVMCVCV